MKIESIDIMARIFLEDFNARREEINKLIEATIALSNFCFVGIGALLSVSPYLYESGLTDIFALFPIVFHALLWSQLHLIIRTINLCNYVNNTIAPEIQAILSNLSGKDYSHFFSWESKGRNKVHALRKLWMAPLAGSRYGIPLIAAVLSFLTFCKTLDGSGFSTLINIFLIGINIFAFLYSFFSILEVNRMLKSEN